MIRRIALAAILCAGCRGGSKSAQAPGSASPATLGSAPAQFADLPPGDTAGVITMMRQTMQRIDSAVAQVTPRDTLVTLPGDSVPRHLTLWEIGGAPRKLVVTDSNAAGQNNGETDVWFTGGDVAVIEQVSDFYAFDSGRIVLWTDDTMQPRADLTTDLLMARETALMDTVRRWLMVFGVALP